MRPFKLKWIFLVGLVFLRFSLLADINAYNLTCYNPSEYESKDGIGIIASGIPGKESSIYPYTILISDLDYEKQMKKCLELCREKNKTDCSLRYIDAGYFKTDTYLVMRENESFPPAKQEKYRIYCYAGKSYMKLTENQKVTGSVFTDPSIVYLNDTIYENLRAKCFEYCDAQKVTRSDCLLKGSEAKHYDKTTYTILAQPLSSMALAAENELNDRVLYPGLIFRSSLLGADGWQKFEEKHKVKLQTVVHLNTHGNSSPSDYNMAELDEAKKRHVRMLHPYAQDAGDRVYVDGRNPADPHLSQEAERGNVYKQETVENIFVKDEAMRKKLGLKYFEASKSYGFEKEGPVVLEGNTLDVLQSLLKIVEADWPIDFHCKGGVHRTGIIDMLITYLIANYCDPILAKKIISRDSPIKYSVSKWGEHINNFGKAFQWRGPGLTSILWNLTLGETCPENDLSPLEYQYALHAGGLYRFDNIIFVREVIGVDEKYSKDNHPKALDTEEKRALWKKIQSQFMQKIGQFDPEKAGCKSLRRKEYNLPEALQ